MRILNKGYEKISILQNTAECPCYYRHTGFPGLTPVHYFFALQSGQRELADPFPN